MSRALVIDDDEGTRYALTLLLERDRMTVETCQSGEDGLAACLRQRPDVIFLDLAMPGMDGIAVLEAVAKLDDSPPVVVITGAGTPSTTIRAVQLGAYEYLTKPLDADRVRLVARRAAELHGLKTQLEALRQPQARSDEACLVGEHPKMREVYMAIGRVTATHERTTVLIHGETGTGKELVARTIHQSGRDAAKPFVVVNCAALPENLIESELFGHERGSFTGAAERRPGKVELAGEGTLFLDEVASLTPPLQRRFLRLLQEREFERVGGREVLRAQARFVAASNVDLAEEVGAGRFREDLYFRLSVFPLGLPPLRERLSDLPLLVADAIRRFNARMRRDVKGLGPGVMGVLQGHMWPGNVRELENVVHYAMLRTSGDLITMEALPPVLLAGPEPTGESTKRPPFEQARRQAVSQFERRYLAGLLEECGGNVTAASVRAGVRRQSLQRLLRRHGLQARTFRGAGAPDEPDDSMESGDADDLDGIEDGDDRLGGDGLA